MVSMNKKTSLKLQGARMLTTCYDPFKEEHLWGWGFFWGGGGWEGCWVVWGLFFVLFSFLSKFSFCLSHFYPSLVFCPPQKYRLLWGFLDCIMWYKVKHALYVFHHFPTINDCYSLPGLFQDPLNYFTNNHCYYLKSVLKQYLRLLFMT